MTTLLPATGSPYAIGAALGLVEAFAFATAKRGLGVTSAFESTAALAERKIAPDLTHVNEYIQKRDERPKVDWESFLVVGVLAGSYLAARAAGEKATSAMPKRWKKRFGSSRAKRTAGAFLGGAAMMFGARMAKGCTSGHGLTGNMQLAVSSWTFSAIMGASAVLVARALYGKEAR
jgi:uncharacterized protein